MNDRGKIALIYTTVAVFSLGFIGGMMYLSKQAPEQPLPVYSDTGAEKEAQLFPIAKDFGGVNQEGKQVKLSELKGKVWVVSEFFAVCPKCAQRTGSDLTEIYQRFKDHPDFHMVCVSVDPNTDNQEKLQDYARTFEADPGKWWFLSHPDEQETHEYLEKTLKFFGIRERTDEVDRASNGRFAHDMGIMLVDREWNVIGKWPLYDAASEEGRKNNPPSTRN